MHSFCGDLRLCRTLSETTGGDRASVDTLLALLLLPEQLIPLVGSLQEHDRTITKR